MKEIFSTKWKYVRIWIQSHTHTHTHMHTCTHTHTHRHTHTHTLTNTHTHTHTHTHTNLQTPTSLFQNSRNALHLAAYRGHLPVLQCLCPMFGDRVLDRDGNGETCLDIARRLGRKSIAEFLTQNYPRLQGKVGWENGYTREEMDPWAAMHFNQVPTFIIDRVVLTWTLAWQLRVLALQRGIVLLHRRIVICLWNSWVHTVQYTVWYTMYGISLHFLFYVCITDMFLPICLYCTEHACPSALWVGIVLLCLGLTDADGG